MRVALVTEIPAPYRVPLFNALAAHPEVELHVFFLAAADPRRDYESVGHELDVESTVLRGRGVSFRRRWLVVNGGVRRALAAFEPEALVLGGWNQPAMWQALAFARARRLRVVPWVESTARESRTVTRVLDRIRRGMLARATAVLVPGRASADYVRALGVPAERVVVAPNAVDLRIFSETVAMLSRDRDAVRSTLGVSSTTALYVGRLDPEKRVDLLLQATRDVDTDVVVVGDGTERAALEAAAHPRVRFTGWLTRDALTRWYAAADVFVLPSTSEPWGMVLNEAAAAALPIVATDAAGAAWELVDDGVNGFRVRAGDVTELHDAIRRLAADPSLRAAAARRSREIAAAFTPEAWAAAVARALGVAG